MFLNDFFLKSTRLRVTGNKTPMVGSSREWGPLVQKMPCHPTLFLSLEEPVTTDLQISNCVGVCSSGLGTRHVHDIGRGAWLCRALKVGIKILNWHLHAIGRQREAQRSWGHTSELWPLTWPLNSELAGQLRQCGSAPCSRALRLSSWNITRT